MASAGGMTDDQVFLKRIEPHLDVLLETARSDLRYHEARGDLRPGELSAEEIVGETLIRARHDQERRPPELSLEAWLLGLEARVMIRLLEAEERARELWAYSLEQPIPKPPPPLSDDTYWDWHQPDDVERWEDVLSGEPVVAEEPAEEHVAALSPLVRRAWVLLDRRGLSVRDVALILRRSMDDVADLVREAREALRPLTDRPAQR